MPVKLKDMSLLKNAIALSSLNSGVRALITNIINESNASNIASGAGTYTKKAFYNQDARLRTNAYGVFTPVNPAK